MTHSPIVPGCFAQQQGSTSRGALQRQLLGRTSYSLIIQNLFRVAHSSCCTPSTVSSSRKFSIRTLFHSKEIQCPSVQANPKNPITYLHAAFDAIRLITISRIGNARSTFQSYQQSPNIRFYGRSIRFHGRSICPRNASSLF